MVFGKMVIGIILLRILSGKMVFGIVDILIIYLVKIHQHLLLEMKNHFQNIMVKFNIVIMINIILLMLIMRV
jgi:hypothetical protein